MTAARPACRLVLRAIVRERRAFAASALLVAIAVALFVGYAVISTSSDVSLDARVARALGGADGRIGVVRPATLPMSVASLTDPTDIVRALGSGAVVNPLVETPTRFAVPGHSAAATATLGDFTSPVVQPLFQLRAGRWPARADETALSAQLANRLGLGLGSSVRPGSGAVSATVVGVLVDPVDTRASFAVLPLADQALRSALTGDQVETSVVFLVKASATQLRDSGLPYLDRQKIADRAAEAHGRDGVGLPGTAALLACVSAAVFGLAARRQRRTAALLDLLGAGFAVRLLVPALTLLLLAVVALLLGTGVAFGGATAALPLLAERAGQQWAAARLPGVQLALMIGILALTALGAVAASAVALRRWGARALVAGREASGAPGRRWAPVVGGAAGLGVAAGWLTRLPVVVILASVVLAVALSQLVVALVGAALHRVGGPVWLAIAVRNLERLSSIPRALLGILAAFAAFSSFAALLLTSLVLSTGYVPQLPAGTSLFSSSQQLTSGDLARAAGPLGADRYLQFRDVIRNAGGLRSYLQVRNPLQECLRNDTSGSTATCARQEGWPVLSPRVSFLDADEVATYLGRSLSPAERRTYLAGSALVLFPALLDQGRVTLWAGPSAEGSFGSAAASTAEDDTILLPALALPSSAPPASDAPAVLLPPTLAGHRGLTFGTDWNVLFISAVAPPTAQEDEARDLLVGASGGVGTLSVERGDPQLPLAHAIITATTVTVGVLGSATATLLAVLVAATLQTENAVLDAIGASSRTRRAAVATQVLLPTALAFPVGSLVGAVAAWLCAGFEHAGLSGRPVEPLAAAALLAVVVSGVAAAAATAQRPGPPRQPS